MKLKVLLDNNTLIDRYFFGEPGVSYLIEDESVNILFDTGYSDAFIRNAQKMDTSLMNIDFLVISHGHIDHTWGLVPLIKLYTEARIESIKYNKPTLIAHPCAFLYKEYEVNQEIGSLISEEKLSRHFKMNLSKEPVWLSDKIVFLGEIERKNNFENKTPIGKSEYNGVKLDDYVIDDSAIVYKSSEGLVIITGCSHAGICNIIEYAKKICVEDRIADIVGGFHLLDPSREQLERTIEYFEKQHINEVHACHCTDLKSKIELSKVVNLKDVGVGLTLEYE
jgi:7,8-dihydropterin-6-yl-methyl-4-(beta-D-ribofuranosyl)aminobenzene 5'-phosphate synthase